MSQFLDNLMARASERQKTIALAEGFDIRACKAAEMLTKDGVCKVVLIGDEADAKA
ncbi:MAG: phosphate acetyltransferase, partial [Clostridia bacterium]|nr:phosphate acetyltransferase [Clostridia bacterium]